MLNICFVFTLTNLCFAGRFEKSGEYYRYFEDDGSVARNKIIEYDRKRYYVNDEGYAVLTLGLIVMATCIMLEMMVYSKLKEFMR